VQSLTGGASIGFEEALGMGAPSKVEEQKRAVLRALNDLKFELGVGKISKADFDELSAKYREEAKRLMQTLDQTLEPARQQVEEQLERRLKRAGLSVTPDPTLPPTTSAETSDEPAKNAEVES
jgi:TRAP-type C4-dicarboxylate transport system substrate-binding protein